jgi:hypothetical protein
MYNLHFDANGTGGDHDVFSESFRKHCRGFGEERRVRGRRGPGWGETSCWLVVVKGQRVYMGAEWEEVDGEGEVLDDKKGKFGMVKGERKRTKFTSR